MLLEEQSSNTVVCHCLGITEREIRAAAAFGGCQTIADVKVMTAAGSGCTSCHCRIIALLQKARAETASMNSGVASGSAC